MKKTEILSEGFSLNLTPTEAARIRRICETEERSAASVIRRLVRKALERPMQPEPEA
jgi:hypothetical protein